MSGTECPAIRHPTLQRQCTPSSHAAHPSQLGCNHIGDEGVKAIAIALLSNGRQSRLVWLALGGNKVTDKGVEHFAVALRAQQGNSSTTAERGESGKTTVSDHDSWQLHRRL